MDNAYPFFDITMTLELLNVMLTTPIYPENVTTRYQIKIC